MEADSVGAGLMGADVSWPRSVGKTVAKHALSK
jgi:hypothetical protein